MTFTSAKCILWTVNFWLFCTDLQQIRGAPAVVNRARASIMTDWSQYNHHEIEGNGTYAFGYDIEDPDTNNVQFRSEERHSNGTITGSYGYLEPDGNIHMVHYVADGAGFRATVEDSARTGMLKPIPVLDDQYTIAYGYSPEMIAAMKAKQIYKHQKIYEQRLRPLDQQNEEQKLFFESENGKDSSYNEGDGDSAVKNNNKDELKEILPSSQYL